MVMASGELSSAFSRRSSVVRASCYRTGVAIHHASHRRGQGPAADSFALEASFIATVAPLMRRLRTAVMSVADWGQLTFADHAVLDLLSRAGPLRQGDIARHLGVSAPVVTRLVKGLTQLTLVTRTPDPADARSVVVILTPTGARRAAAMHADVLAAAARLLQPLPHETRDHIGMALDDLQVLVPSASRDLVTG